MYRVELKELSLVLGKDLSTLLVPNVPCGVESHIGFYLQNTALCVPNVPCGVERTLMVRGCSGDACS